MKKLLTHVFVLTLVCMVPLVACEKAQEAVDAAGEMAEEGMEAAGEMVEEGAEAVEKAAGGDKGDQ